ncbi:Cap15 family cyclic dinucleotide receptor domain-containing protein [Salibacter halophilus]|uniref:CD-NTase-associated protein 15 domain-containing protein n=1 Tax=Salibacter halophilus TaxID=1803916 RepID=A0A6N6M480_9FLAO|nr:hypothetical protein [Salibacter halophilus]KAB1064088.1 hypothetical protein F3059_08640 [Salibacter halophilus]
MSFKYYYTTPLIVIILSLAGLIDLIIDGLLFPLMKDANIEFLRAPGNASLIASFLLLYDRVLWKLPVFNLLVDVPNINGRYEGKVKYEFHGSPGETECFVEVKQTSSAIKVNSYFKNENKPSTNSKSLVESIKKEDGFHSIYLYYFNNGSKENADLDCHEGANMLKFIPAHNNEPQKLIGHYFTNRKEQTRGIMEVEFKSKKLKGIF